MDYEDQHWARVISVDTTPFNKLKTGSILRFPYNGRKRMVLLLNPKWHDKMHALALELLSIPILTRICQGLMDNISEADPMDPNVFYSTYISKQSAIKTADCYRTFDINKIGGMPKVLTYDFGKISRLFDYENYGEYTPDNAKTESGEYFNNAYTQLAFPNAFKDVEELVDEILNGKLEFLSREDLMVLENCNVRDILISASPKKIAIKYSEEYGRNWQRISNGLLAGDSIPPAIILRHTKGNYLLAGNTRMMIGAAWGFNMPAIIIYLDKDKEKDIEEDEADKADEGKDMVDDVKSKREGL